MEDSEYQSLLERALRENVASFEISSERRALVFSFTDQKEFIEKMDKLWACGNELLVPQDKKIRLNTTPTFKIDEYTISPTYRQKRVRNGNHLYDFLYSPK